MRPLALLTAFLIACGGPAAAPSTPTPSLEPTSTPTATQSDARACAPTQTRDPDGVVTADGRFGILGAASTFGEDMNGMFLLVRKGAVTGDRVALHFRQIGSSAPASSVDFGVTASPRSTPWGSAAFNVGWKPIAFSNSCWSLLVDGVETGLVLAVGSP